MLAVLSRADNFPSKSVPYFGGLILLTQRRIENIAQLRTKLLLHFRCTPCRGLVAEIGAGGNQRVSKLFAKRTAYRVSGDAYRQHVVLAAY